MTTTIRGTDNTAAAPALTGTDTDTGIFFPAADTIAFAEGGVEVGRFDSVGNFGIGMTPIASLSIGKTTTALSGTGNAYGAYLYPTATGQCWLDAVTGSTSATQMGIRSYNNGTYYSANLDFNGNFQFNSGYGSTATAYGCRAWVNFNSNGTLTIRASGNTSSVTDNGVGDFTMNFSVAMPDANYAIIPSCDSESAGSTTRSPQVLSLLLGSTPTTSSARLTLKIGGFSTAGAVQVDSGYCFVSIFR